jgi:hypothetical protein
MIQSKVKYDIIKTKDPNIIKFILPLSKKLIDKNKFNYTLEGFAKWLRIHIDNPYLGLWICVKKIGGNKLLKEEKKLVGYIVISFLEYLGEEQIIIYHICSIDKNKNVSKKLMETVENYAKQNGVKKLIALTSKKHSKAMCKLFGAKEQSVLITKEI